MRYVPYPVPSPYSTYMQYPEGQMPTFMVWVVLIGALAIVISFLCYLVLLFLDFRDWRRRRKHKKKFDLS